MKSTKAREMPTQHAIVRGVDPSVLSPEPLELSYCVITPITPYNAINIFD